jgi:hypothetical protein
MTGFLAVAMFLVALGIVVNHFHAKSDAEYAEYREELSRISD